MAIRMSSFDEASKLGASLSPFPLLLVHHETFRRGPEEGCFGGGRDRGATNPKHCAALSVQGIPY